MLRLWFLLFLLLTPTRAIRCPTGWGENAQQQTIPDQRINDGYCDCPTTGADEPDTEACAGRQFWPGSPHNKKEEDEMYE